MTWVYVLFIVLAVLGIVFFDRQEGFGKYKTIAYRCLYVFLICMVGFSYALGGDKVTYMGYFEYYYDELDQIWECITYELAHHGFMPLWTLLCLLVKSTTDSFYVMQFVLAILVNVPICEIVRKHTSHGFLFLLLYFVSELFFQFNTEVMREGPAIALSLLAVENYLAGRKKSFVALAVLGLGFHLSALVVLLVPLVPHIELTRKHIVVLFAIALGGWVLSDMVLQPILSYFLGHDAGAIGRKVVTYAAIQTTFWGFMRSFLSMMVLPVATLYFLRNQQVSDDERVYRDKMSDLLIALSLVGCVFAGFTRFFNYVQIFYLIMLAELIYHLLDTKVHLIARAATVVAAFAFWIWYEVTYWPENDFRFYQFFVPYTCILNEDEEDRNLREDAYGEVCNYDFYEDRVLDAQ